MEIKKYLDGIDGTVNYTNSVIYKAIETGETITEDWLTKHLLGLVEEEMLTYEESFIAYNIYVKLLDKINLNKSLFN